MTVATRLVKSLSMHQCSHSEFKRCLYKYLEGTTTKYSCAQSIDYFTPVLTSADTCIRHNSCVNKRKRKHDGGGEPVRP